MICERYWREGILEVERGEPDPHRNTCSDCRRAHEARAELIRALPRVGAARGDPSWQVQVWSRIARDETLRAGHEARRARRSSWLGGGLAAACVLAVVWLLVVHREADSPSQQVAVGPGDRPRIDIVSGTLALRSTSARVGDRVRISVSHGGEVRIYRSDHLVLRCPAWQRSASCTLDRAGLVAEAELATPGEYRLVLIPSLTAEPVGTLDEDLAAVVSFGGSYKLTELSVR